MPLSLVKENRTERSSGRYLTAGVMCHENSDDNMVEKNDIRDIDPSVAELVLFLQEGPKTDSEIIAGIPAFNKDTLGKVRTLELVEPTFKK